MDPSSTSEPLSGPRLSLVLRGPNLPGIPDVSIPLNNVPAAAAVGQPIGSCIISEPQTSHFYLRQHSTSSSNPLASFQHLAAKKGKGRVKSSSQSPEVGTGIHPGFVNLMDLDIPFLVSSGMTRMASDDDTITGISSNKSSANTTPTNLAHDFADASFKDVSSYAFEMQTSAMPVTSASGAATTPLSSRPFSAIVDGSSCPPRGGVAYTDPVPLLEPSQCLASAPDTTIFAAVQNLMNCVPFQSRQEKLRRIWEPTYV